MTGWKPIPLIVRSVPNSRERVLLHNVCQPLHPPAQRAGSDAVTAGEGPTLPRESDDGGLVLELLPLVTDLWQDHHVQTGELFRDHSLTASGRLTPKRALCLALVRVP